MVTQHNKGVETFQQAGDIFNSCLLCLKAEVAENCYCTSMTSNFVLLFAWKKNFHIDSFWRKLCVKKVFLVS